MGKDRNCGMPYPIYPMPQGYQGMVPMMPNQTMSMPGSNTIEQQLNSLSNQVSNLEKRVTSLESVIGNNTGYSSNYQMM